MPRQAKPFADAMTDRKDTVAYFTEQSACAPTRQGQNKRRFHTEAPFVFAVHTSTKAMHAQQQNSPMQSVSSMFSQIERMAEILAQSNFVPATLRNKPDCFVLCMKAIAENRAPTDYLAWPAGQIELLDLPSAAEETANALLSSTNQQEFAAAESMLNKLATTDEMSNVLALVHGHMLQRHNPA